MGSTDINMSPNIAVFLLLLLSIALEVEGNDCCEEKKVGSISYTLHQPYSPSLPDQCLDNCVYTILGLSTPKYCFQQGDLLTECLSDTTTTTTTPKTIPTPTTTTTTITTPKTTTTTITTPTTTLPVQGVVSSPNFPDDYPSNIEKHYTIEVDQGLPLFLEFTWFDLHYEYTMIDMNTYFACETVTLSIIDGNGATLMDKQCGWKSLVKNITSVSNVVKIIFRSGDVNSVPVVDPGRPKPIAYRWSLNWTAVFARGELNSPNYPNSPPANLDEKYTIEVDQGLILMLEISYNLQEDSYEYDYNYNYIYTCGESHLTIIDGDGTTLIKESGGNSWGSFWLTARSNNVTVHFHTDEDPSNEFFTINWLAVKPRATI